MPNLLTIQVLRSPPLSQTLAKSGHESLSASLLIRLIPACFARKVPPSIPNFKKNGRHSAEKMQTQSMRMDTYFRARTQKPSSLLRFNRLYSSRECLRSLKTNCIKFKSSSRPISKRTTCYVINLGKCWKSTKRRQMQISRSCTLLGETCVLWFSL